MKQVRQGDVLIQPVSKLPDGIKSITPQDNKIVLAEGEVTGHAHVMEAKHVEEFVTGDSRFVNVHNKTPLKHQEHGDIAVEKGVGKIIRQREYAPESIHHVQD